MCGPNRPAASRVSLIGAGCRSCWSRRGIRHLWLGESLGGKPADPALHDSDGAPDYEKIRMQPVFADGIEQLARLARTVSVAIMCAEEDPANCHRTLLIAPALSDCGVSVSHIRKDGSAQHSL